MKKKILLTVFCSLALLSTGCVKEQKLQDGKEVVASVGEKNFTAEDFYENLKKSYGASVMIDMIDNYIAGIEIPDDTDSKVKAKEYVQALKDQSTASGTDWNTLLTSNGFSSEEELIETYKTYYLKEEVAQKWYKDNVTDKEISKYYNDEIIGDITAKHILIEAKTTDSMTKDEKEEALKKALETAKEVINKLNNGEDFDKLAKEYSNDDATKENGGLLPAFNKQSNLDSNFIKEAVKLDVSKYSSSPVKSEYGYHIIYIKDKAEKPSLDKVKDNIISTLAKNKMDENEKYYYTAWIKLREQYKLNINDTIVKEAVDTIVSQYK